MSKLKQNNAKICFPNISQLSVVETNVLWCFDFRIHVLIHINWLLPLIGFLKKDGLRQVLECK
jgi:hypothetical protein